MCPPEEKMKPIDPDEEPTQPIPAETTAQIKAEWEAEMALPSDERPTRRFRKLTRP